VLAVTVRLVEKTLPGGPWRGRITFFSEYRADVTPWRDCPDAERVSGRY
jgi:hypothetical protein